jgi:Helix-turn-helix.
LLDTLKKIRSDTNLSVEETAKRIGISKGYYSMIVKWSTRFKLLHG